MDENNIVESFLRTVVSLCEIFDQKECEKCSLYSKCIGQNNPSLIQHIRDFIKQ